MWGLAILLVLFILPNTPPPQNPSQSAYRKWLELDFIGAFLFIAGLAVFLYGLNSGGNTYPWKAGGTLAPLILGLIVFLAAFVYDFIVLRRCYEGSQ